MPNNYHPYKDRKEHDNANRMATMISRGRLVTEQGKRVYEELGLILKTAALLIDDLEATINEQLEDIKTRKRNEDVQ